MKVRCFKCKKKIILGCEQLCKCSNTFCLNCLPSFEHNCSFDYKEEKKKILSEQNIKIQKSKVEII